MKITAITLVMTVGLALPAGGQPVPQIVNAPGKPIPEEPSITQMTVHPAAEPEPALRYQLLPDLFDQTPGNGAVLYLTAYGHIPDPQQGKDTQSEKVDEWLAMPLDQMPTDQVRQTVSRWETVLHQIAVASRREDCKWDWPIRSEGFHTLLPRFSEHRKAAKVLALRARLAMAEGRVDDALNDLQTGLAMARHVGAGPMLIEGLVGISIARLMLDQVEAMVQMPDAPNLYWALTELPAPFIDIRHAMRNERNLLYYQHPILKKLVRGQIEPHEQQAMGPELARAIGSIHGMVGGAQTGAEVIFAMKAYPLAKRRLIEQGLDREAVEAMPVAYVVSLHSLGRYEHWRDEIFKWHSLPYWQAHAGYRRSEAALANKQKDLTEGSPFTALLPAFGRAHWIFVRLDRHIAALRCIEAIRMHADEHGGGPPTSLDQVTIVPIPIDPATGKPFGYKRDNKMFTLDGPAPPAHEVNEGLRYIVTIQP